MLRTPPTSGVVSTWLSREEAARLSRYRKPADRWRLLLGRAILRFMLSEGYNITATDIILTAKGKPVLARSPNKRLDFSITHDGQWVAVGITEHGRIGIDISEITNFPNWSEFVHQYLDLSEITQLRKLAPSEIPVAAARFWTLKEAILKATGHGLEVDPRKVVLRLAPVPIIRQLPAGLPSSDLFHLEERELLDGSRLAIAYLSEEIDSLAPCIFDEICTKALMSRNGREQNPSDNEA